MRIYKVMFFLFLLLLVPIFTAVADQFIKIRVADWPPSYFKDNTGKWTGIDVEVAEYIVKSAGFKPEFEEMTWSRGLQNLKDGNVQIVCNMVKSEERSQFINWVGPYKYDTANLVVRKDNINLPINTFDDIITFYKSKKIKFGCLQDADFGKQFHSRMENDPEFKNCFYITPLHNSLLKMTVAGRLIGFFESPVEVAYKIKNIPEYKELAIHRLKAGRTKLESGAYIGLSKKGVSRETYDFLNIAFIEGIKNGSIQKIINKWNPTQ